MKKIKFYDVKNKKSFNSNDYDFVKSKNPHTGRYTYMIRAKITPKLYSYRIVSEKWWKENKK